MVGLWACGGEGPSEASSDMPVGFQAHALECEVEGLEAWLRVSGVDGVCRLDVGPDNTVSGRCRGVPGRAERVLRLEYFTVIVGFNVPLAAADDPKRIR